MVSVSPVSTIASSTKEGEFVPNPLDPKVHLAVTHGVARAAMETGVAQWQLDPDYFECDDVNNYPEI